MSANFTQRDEIKEIKDEPFNKSIMISALSHGILLVGFVLKTVFYPSETIILENAVRVDMVGLPEKVTEPPSRPAAPVAAQEPAPEKPVVKEEPPPAKKEPEPPKPVAEKPPEVKALPKKTQKDADAISLKQAKRDQKSAIEKLNTQSAIAKLKEKAASQERAAAEAARQEALSNFRFKGNKISPGNSLTGVEKLQYDDYSDKVQNQAQTHWNLPEWLKAGGYKARVLVRLNSRGVVIGTSFIQASGNDVFDDYVIETIKKASPFPEPPSKFEDILEVKGMELRFP